MAPTADYIPLSQDPSTPPTSSSARPPSPLSPHTLLVHLTPPFQRVVYIALGGLCSLFFLLRVVPTVFFSASSSSSPAPLSPPSPAEPPEPPESAYVPAADPENFYRLFKPVPPAVADAQVRARQAHEAITDECLEEWIGRGRWAGTCMDVKLSEPRVDLTWLWVNGSDPLHRAVREKHTPAKSVRPAEKQFRDHDELRHSMRAAKAATASWPSSSTWHLVTADMDVPDGYGAAGLNETDTEGKRLAQVPQWLDLDALEEERGEGEERLLLHHHHDFFRPITPSGNMSEIDLTGWRERALPSFNSFAIESQLANLDPAQVSDNIIAFNDDQFLALPLPPSAFHSSLYGPVFRIQPDLLVQGSDGGNQAGTGEWRALAWSGLLLNERFGRRRRPYLAHNARSLSLSLLHEASLVFQDTFTSTPLNRFRGSNKDVPEVHTIFLATHFVIERHREALLWSWAVAKWGGVNAWIGEEAKKAMWEELGGEETVPEIKLVWPKREGRSHIEEEMRAAGLRPPGSKNPELQGDTEYIFTSQDGYPTSYLPLPQGNNIPQVEGLPDLTAEASGTWPSRGILKRNDCIGTDGEPAYALFRWLLVDKPRCGDHVISALLSATGASGISAFLPPPTSSPTDPNPSPAYLPLELRSPTSDTSPLPPNPRAFVLRLLQRYAYALGATPSRFVSITSPAQAQLELVHRARANTALLCLNDDLKGDFAIKKAGIWLRAWLEDRWGEKMRMEL